MAKPKEKGSIADLAPAYRRVEFTVPRRVLDEVVEDRVVVNALELSVTTLARVASLLRPIWAEIEAAPNLMTVLDVASDEIVDVVAVAVDVPRETVSEWPSGAFMQVLMAVLEVNTDFFVRRLPPVAFALSAMRAASDGVGRTPLSTSNDEESATPAASH